MKTSVIRVITILLSICIIINLAHEIYLRLYSPYDTTVVYEYTVADELDAQGMIFKDETLLDNENSGVVKYLAKNGSKVSVDSQVAMIYQNENDVSATAKIESIDVAIKQLTDAQSPGVSLESSISIVNQQLFHTYLSLISNIEQQQVLKIPDLKNELTFALNKKQILTGKIGDFNNTIDQLAEHKEELQNTISSQPDPVLSPFSGYFVDTTDGYESQLTLEYANSISHSALKDLIDGVNAPEETAGIGKIMTKPALKYVALVPTRNLTQLKPNQSCSIQFSDIEELVPATIEKITLSEDQESSVVVFGISYMTEALSILRQGDGKIILSSHTGLRIPKAAIRTSSENQQGVYVVNGAHMVFKKTDVVYENEEYILCKDNNSDSSYVRLYDTIIVKGKDLYDNKPVK